jgi:hypothetical protein
VQLVRDDHVKTLHRRHATGPYGLNRTFGPLLPFNPDVP